MFGTNKNHTGYAPPSDDLPVATIVEEISAARYTAVQASAPAESSSAPSATTKPSGGCCTSNANPHETLLDRDPTISRFPMMMQECPNCHRETRTRVLTKPSCKTWVASGIMVCVFWPLCWIPLVSDSCKETEHFCVSCGARVAKIDAFQDCCVEHRG
eukprot:jgi/Psemu1/304842/fgenesh1_kg.170_\